MKRINLMIIPGRILLILLCVVSLSMRANEADINIKGNIMEKEGDKLSAMESVTISLLDKDSVLVTGTISGKKGNFLLNNVRPGDYVLRVSFVGYETIEINLKNLSKNLNLGVIEIHESAVMLKEFSVSASNITHKVDRMVVLPTQEALHNAYDSYQLMNNLAIPRLLVNPMNKSLEANGRAVQTRINGIKASAAEVGAILAKDILRIEVIENPGERYGDSSLGAVINIVVRKRETGGLVNLQTGNAVTIPAGENNFSVKYNKGKSQWGINYNVNYRSFEKIKKDINETYFLENKTIERVQEGIDDKLKFTKHAVNLTYNLSDPDKYTFNVIFKNNIDDTPHNDLSAKLYSVGSPEYIYSKTYQSNFNYSPALDIYFQRNLPDNQSLQFNVIGTLINTESNRTYREYTESSSNLTYIETDVDGKKQSVIAEGIYDKTFEKVKISAGMRHYQMHTENKYRGSNPTVSDMNQSQTSGFVEVQGKVKKFSYLGSVGLTRSYFEERNQNNTYYTFTPTARLSYVPHKYGYINYRFNTTPSIPALGSLTDVEQALDTIQIVRGNPALKTFNKYNNSLSYTYNKKKFMGLLNVEHTYYNNPIMERVFVEGDKLIIMDENQKSYQNLLMNAVLVIRGMNVGSLKNFFTLQLEGGYHKYWSEGNHYNHVYDNFYYMVRGMLMYKKFMFMGEYRNSRNHLYGETINKGENQTNFMATYNYKRLQVGAFILFPFTNNFRTGTERISKVAPVKTWTYSKEAGRMVMISLNYNFEFGKKYRSGRRGLNNTDTDAGILNTNR